MRVSLQLKSCTKKCKGFAATSTNRSTIGNWNLSMVYKKKETIEIIAAAAPITPNIAFQSRLAVNDLIL